MGHNQLRRLRRPTHDHCGDYRARLFFGAFGCCRGRSPGGGATQQHRLFGFPAWGVFMAVAGLYLLLNASFVAAAQVLVYVGAVNVLILFAIMLVNKREDLKAIANLTTRRVVSAGVCLGLLALLVRVVVTTPWNLPGPAAVGEEATARIGEHLFTDYLLPFELASVLLLMAMIGAIVLARRDVLATDVVTGEVADQGLIEKSSTPLLLERPSS